jgi:hypothetical protein
VFWPEVPCLFVSSKLRGSSQVSNDKLHICFDCSSDEFSKFWATQLFEYVFEYCMSIGKNIDFSLCFVHASEPRLLVVQELDNSAKRIWSRPGIRQSLLRNTTIRERAARRCVYPYSTCDATEISLVSTGFLHVMRSEATGTVQGVGHWQQGLWTG